MTQSMVSLLVFGVVLILGIAVSLPAYGRLLRNLRRDHPLEFGKIGRPTLYMRSPSRSLALQRFIYFDSRSPTISPRVSRLCRLLGIFIPLYLVALFATLAWFLSASWAGV